VGKYLYRLYVHVQYCAYSLVLGETGTEVSRESFPRSRDACHGEGSLVDLHKLKETSPNSHTPICFHVCQAGIKRVRQLRFFYTICLRGKLRHHPGLEEAATWPSLALPGRVPICPDLSGRIGVNFPKLATVKRPRIIRSLVTGRKE
jgi:hypothetical protein